MYIRLGYAMIHVGYVIKKLPLGRNFRPLVSQVIMGQSQVVACRLLSPKRISGWWARATPLKNMSQLGWLETQYFWEHNKCSKPPTSDGYKPMIDYGQATNSANVTLELVHWLWVSTPNSTTVHSPAPKPAVQVTTLQVQWPKGIGIKGSNWTWRLLVENHGL